MVPLGNVKTTVPLAEFLKESIVHPDVGSLQSEQLQ